MALQVGGEVRQVLARLEAGGTGRGDDDLFARPRVATDALLALLHLEHAEAAQFDALAARQRLPHRLQNLLDRALGLHLRDAGLVGYLIDDIGLDHAENTVRNGAMERTATKLSIPWSAHS